MASSSLSRTLGTATDTKKWTNSFWWKPAIGGSQQQIFNVSNGSADNTFFLVQYRDNAEIRLSAYNTTWLTTNRKFRDYSAWYHVVVVADSTESTASNRLKLYINGTEETSFATDNRASISQNQTWGINLAQPHFIGSEGGSGSFIEGSLSHIHFIDGTAYPASTFGETDATTGIWKPKTAPSVTYGTNGFFLKGENSSALGTDSSGNSNTFTVGGTPTQTVDTPANVFATLNPVHFGSDVGTVTMSNGNLTFSNSGSDSWRSSTQAVSSGKYYAEFKTTGVAGAGGVGINSGAVTGYTGSGAYDYVYLGNGIVYNNDNNQGGTFASLSTNDIIGVAVDLDNNKIYFSINGTFQNSADPTSGATGTGAISVADPSSNGTEFYHFTVGDAGTGTVSFQANFGNGFFGTTAVASAQNPDDGIGIFEYDVPAGYRALCTKSINAEEYS